MPFKDSCKDYVLANVQTMSDAIEENIGTLETILAANYASHIHDKIKGTIAMLRQMLEHLDKWYTAQKYWITLDPIYNSGLFEGIFGDDTFKFLDARSELRRIMWTAFRNPKAQYNLMIKDRVPHFVRLIEFYELLQSKAHDYLEEKRLQFTRFFFLNDSQFLDMLRLVNSNQNCSQYVSLLFQGAYKFYQTQIKTSEHLKVLAREDSLGLHTQIQQDQSASSGSEGEEDFEAQMDAYMR